MSGNGFSIQRNIYSVTQLTREIKQLLETGFAGVWVEGEISNLTVARSGHWYFTVKDAGAQLPVVMFKGQNRLFGRPPREGDLLRLHGRLNVYEPRGAYQFVADHLEPAGQGRLMAAFEELKRKLAEEGLFDPELKRQPPFLPTRIALVTSPEGAAVQDMIRVIRRRFPAMPLVIVPTLVQGDSAPSQIVTALERAGGLQDVDLVIVGRGGGSIEDLWAFNDERVARAIRACPVPVISAVGHETDITIADFTADLRASTPSQAGELAVPVRDELIDDLQALQHRLTRAMQSRLAQARHDLRDATHRLGDPQRLLIDQRLRLDGLTHRLAATLPTRIHRKMQSLNELSTRLQQRHPGRRFERHKAHLRTLATRLKHVEKIELNRHIDVFDGAVRRLWQHSPKPQLPIARTRLQGLEHRLRLAMHTRQQIGRQDIARLARALDALSPLKVMERGYSVAFDESGRIVRDATTLTIGAHVTLVPGKGEIEAQVTKISADSTHLPQTPGPRSPSKKHRD